MDLNDCTLCPRNCHVDRAAGQTGYCGQTSELKAARASLHMWEEPCITGQTGSGTVFFSGCNLNCVYCQNHMISKGTLGKIITTKRLVQIYLELQEKNACNINLVTPTHFLPQIKESLEIAKKEGLHIPIVYNTSSYEKPETLRMLDGLIDIYLPDFKYFSSDLSLRYSFAEDYFKYACASLAEMVRQTGTAQFTSSQEACMKKGVIVRHLVLPGCVDDSKNILRYLHETYKNDIYVSIMNQYTPIPAYLNTSLYPELNRTLSPKSYERVIDYAISLGIENGFIQEDDVASESFIPQFDYFGI